MLLPKPLSRSRSVASAHTQAFTFIALAGLSRSVCLFFLFFLSFSLHLPCHVSPRSVSHFITPRATFCILYREKQQNADLERW